jgi:short-subunit dehydrogenase
LPSAIGGNAVLRGRVARRQGWIVNIAGSAGLQAIAYTSAYVTSKTALMGFSENLALETHAYDISVFKICPDLVCRAMTEELITAGERWPPQLPLWHDVRRLSACWGVLDEWQYLIVVNLRGKFCVWRIESICNSASFVTERMKTPSKSAIVAGRSSTKLTRGYRALYIIT